MSDSLTTKINTIEMLTVHAQHVKITDLVQVCMQKHQSLTPSKLKNLTKTQILCLKNLLFIPY